MNYEDNDFRPIFCNRLSRAEYYYKQLLLTIMMQLAFSKQPKHVWYEW